MSSSHFEEVGSSFLIITVGSRGEVKSAVLLRNFDGESLPDLNASIKFPRLLLLELPAELILFLNVQKCYCNTWRAVSPRLFIYPALDKISNSACPSNCSFFLPVRGASNVMQNAGGSECTSQPCLKTQSEKGRGLRTLQQGKEGLYSHKLHSNGTLGLES